MTALSSEAASNRAKAPIAAAFVAEMREEFGDVKVLYVEEGEVKIGQKPTKGEG